jgi:formiminoglutamase
MQIDDFYVSPLPAIWSGREDVSNGRLFQHVQMLDCQNMPETLNKSIVFLGFASDEGVRRNLGRVGASQGPESLRKALKNIPLSVNDARTIWDAGTVVCSGDLENAQRILGDVVAELRQRGAFVIVLGGGHEVAWGHFKGLSKSIKNIDILNFDAHFDLRPLLPEQKGSSGTGFRQMYDDCQKKKTVFHYACFGVQPMGNTVELFNYADSINTHYYLAETMLNEPEVVQDALSEWLLSAQNIYLTLCLDVFAAACAPGVSAPQAMGLLPHSLLPFFRQVLQSGKVVGFDVAELNPVYDRDEQTAMLAAYFIAEVLRNVG